MNEEMVFRFWKGCFFDRKKLLLFYIIQISGHMLKFHSGLNKNAQPYNPINTFSGVIGAEKAPRQSGLKDRTAERIAK